VIRPARFFRSTVSITRIFRRVKERQPGRRLSGVSGPRLYFPRLYGDAENMGGGDELTKGSWRRIEIDWSDGGEKQTILA